VGLEADRLFSTIRAASGVHKTGRCTRRDVTVVATGAHAPGGFGNRLWVVEARPLLSPPFRSTVDFGVGPPRLRNRNAPGVARIWGGRAGLREFGPAGRRRTAVRPLDRARKQFSGKRKRRDLASRNEREWTLTDIAINGTGRDGIYVLDPRPQPFSGRSISTIDKRARWDHPFRTQVPRDPRRLPSRGCKASWLALRCRRPRVGRNAFSASA